jgi:hypothetical protein
MLNYQNLRLGLDDIDTSSDEDDDDMPTSSINLQKSSLKRRLSTESTNNFDNDFEENLASEKVENDRNEDENNRNEDENNLDTSINNTSLNNDDGCENLKDRKELSGKARENFFLEKERNLRKKRLEQIEEENKKMQ